MIVIERDSILVDVYFKTKESGEQFVNYWSTLVGGLIVEDRVIVNVWASRHENGVETLDLYFSNLEDAHSFSRFWATVEGEEVTQSAHCRFKVLPNYADDSHPHTLNHYPAREVVDAWMALFEEDKN